MRLLATLPLLAACTSSPPPDAPFTGTVHRYAIDRYDFPTSSDQARQLGDDLDGDHAIDNQVGMLAASLANQMDIARNPLDQHALLPSVFEINAHDLENDDHVGVSYVGRPGDVPTPASGRFEDGNYVSARTVDRVHLANGALVLPIFADADPVEFPIQRGEIDLVADGTGGYTGRLRGVIDPQIALDQAATAIYRMLRSNPHDHLWLSEILTQDLFGEDPAVEVTLANIQTSSALKSLLAPDLQIDGQRWLSFGFGFHLVPCDEGSCAPATVIDHCDDRVQDADETDLDCGGSCRACGFDSRCAVGADCQSGACDAGMCREPTCTDGIQDGFEFGVDCGAYGCPACSN